MADSFRVRSPYFNALAWRTDVLITPGGLELLIDIPPFEKHVAALLAAERNPYDFQRGQMLLRAFCRTGTTPLATTVATKEYATWFKEMMKYRIVDIAAFVHKKGSQPARVPRGFIPEGVTRRLSMKLSHWPNVVSQAKSIIESHHSTLSRSPPSALPNNSVSAAFRALCTRWKVLNTDKIILNFSTAVFVLCYVLEEHRFLPTDKEVISKLLGTLAPDEIPKGLRDAFLSPESFQTAFFVCFAVSPICLLAPTMLFEKNVGKDHLYKYWSGVGNERSPFTERVEQLLWGVIFQAIQDPTNLLSYLRNALVEIEDTELLALDDFEAALFRDGNPLARVKREDEIIILSNGEGEDSQGLSHGTTTVKEEDATTSMDIDQYNHTEIEGSNMDKACRHRTRQHNDPGPSQPVIRKRRRKATPADSTDGQPEETMRSCMPGVSDQHGLKLMSLDDLSKILVEEPRQNIDPLQKKGKLISRETFVLHAPDNNPYHWVPAFHHLEELALFKDIHKVVKNAYVDNMPKWMVSPEGSAICILTKGEMEMKTDAEVHDILRHRHIYIKNQFQPKHQFAEQGLEILSYGRMDKPVVIQDFSRKEADSRHVSGSLWDLLESHKAGTDGKALSALDFPMPWKSNFTSTIASDVRAFNFTMDMPMCPRNTAYPSSTMSWGSAATSGAYHSWYIDYNGLGTFIDVQAGYKWWVMGQPKPGESISNFMTLLHDFDTSSTNEAKFDLEAVLLVPGSRLIMRPFTPHMAYYPESAICHGGHFYAMSTIRRTVYGIYHTFSAGGSLINTKHTQDCLLLLRRLITYIHYILVQTESNVNPSDCHIPNIATIDGALDLFMVCIIVEIGNLLDPASYIEGKVLEPLAGIYARGVARDLLKWWSDNYEFIDKGKIRRGEDVYRELFSHQVRTLIACKRVTARDNGESAADVLQTWLDVSHGLRDKTHSTAPNSSLSFDGPWMEYHVRQRGEIGKKGTAKLTSLAIFKAGATPSDNWHLNPLFHTVDDDMT